MAAAAVRAREAVWSGTMEEDDKLLQGWCTDATLLLVQACGLGRYMGEEAAAHAPAAFDIQVPPASTSQHPLRPLCGA